MARSRDERPFANGFEGESWMNLWCWDCQVDEDECPLIGVAMLGRTPAAWALRDPAGLNRYTCNEYQETEYTVVEEQP